MGFDAREDGEEGKGDARGVSKTQVRQSKEPWTVLTRSKTQVGGAFNRASEVQCCLVWLCALSRWSVRCRSFGRAQGDRLRGLPRIELELLEGWAFLLSLLRATSFPSLQHSHTQSHHAIDRLHGGTTLPSSSSSPHPAARPPLSNCRANRKIAVGLSLPLSLSRDTRSRAHATSHQQPADPHAQNLAALAPFIPPCSPRSSPRSGPCCSGTAPRSRRRRGPCAARPAARASPSTACP